MLYFELSSTKNATPHTFVETICHLIEPFFLELPLSFTKQE